MVALATALAVILLSLLITRVATVALTITGLSREVARFQARSALSGTGFTTSEAEMVVAHPVRRRVVMALMLIGSAGLVTVVASVMLSFTRAGGDQALLRIGVLIGGLLGVWLLSRSRWIDQWLSWAIARLLTRFTDLDARDYGALLHLADRYTVAEIAVRPGDWVEGRSLRELGLREEGLVVLGITLADGSWIGSPTFGTRIGARERLVVYGRAASIAELDRRCAGPDGDRAHADGVKRHRALAAQLEQREAHQRAVRDGA